MLSSVVSIGTDMVIGYEEMSDNTTQQQPLESLRFFFLSSLYPLIKNQESGDYSLDTRLLSKRLLYLLCPITSIFVGLGILKHTYHSSMSPIYRKISYAAIGSLALLGLGCIILALQLSFMALMFSIIVISGTLSSIEETTLCKGSTCLKATISFLDSLTVFLSGDDDDDD